MPRAAEASSMPRPLGVSRCELRLLDRPVKPGDDGCYEAIIYPRHCERKQSNPESLLGPGLLRLRSQ